MEEDRHEVLYIKNRPQTFDEVRGQDLIVQALRGQIIHGRVSHAYLFSGIRGTGKTTVARIFARAINCEHPVHGNPCNVCPTCQAMLRDQSINLTEMNAADQGRVEDIRDLERIISTPPVTGKYRVYIMDETQRMQGFALNAFLKTLEEPPAYVVFILATTERKNLPQTILSRCQNYEFRRLDAATVADQLTVVLEREGRKVDPEGLAYIARLSEGSMRDALTLLDRVLAFSDGAAFSYDQVLAALGNRDLSDYDSLLRYIGEGRADRAVRKCQAILESGIMEAEFAEEFLQYLRDLLMLQTGGDEVKVEATEEQRQAMERTASLVPEKRLIRLMMQFSELYEVLRRQSTGKRALLDEEIVRAALIDEDAQRKELTERVQALEAELRTFRLKEE